MNLKKLFLNHCKKNNLEINSNQLELVDQLNNFYNLNFNKSFLKKIFSNKNTKPLFVDNAEWLTKLNYIQFLRDIGCHFTIMNNI